METDKKPSAIADTMFELSKSYSNVSRTATLYSRLNMIKDIQIYLAQEEIKVKKEMEESDNIK